MIFYYFPFTVIFNLRVSNNQKFNIITMSKITNQIIHLPGSGNYALRHCLAASPARKRMCPTIKQTANISSDNLR